MRARNFLSLALCTTCLFTSLPAYADSKDDRISAMEQQMRVMMQELQALKSERESERAEHVKLQTQVDALEISNIKPAAGYDADSVKITMKPSPKIESADGQYSFQPFGRIHLDATAFNDDVKDHPSNANFRRARLGVKGKLGDDFFYKTEVDFAGEAVNFKEVSLTYSGLEYTDIKVGHLKPALGLQQNTSSNYIQTLERASPTNAFTRGERLGVGTYSGGDNWSLAVGAWNEDAGNRSTSDDEDFSVDVRGSLNVLGLMDTKQENVLHFGAGISHRKVNGTTNFDAKATGVGDDLVDTGSIGLIDDVTVYGAEIAAVVGRASVQGEYLMADVNRESGVADADFDGYYGQASVFLTDDKRPYSGKKGSFSRVKPNHTLNPSNGEWGAVELVTRYENVDLNDIGAGITGGEMDAFTVGLNWYLTNYIRLMANYISVDTDSNATTPNDDPEIVNVRAQWDF